MLQGLTHAPLVYKNESWTNPSLFNGYAGILLRQEKDSLWVVELECNQLVRFHAPFYVLKTRDNDLCAPHRNFP